MAQHAYIIHDAKNEQKADMFGSGKSCTIFYRKM